MRVKMPERKMPLAKISGSGPGWRGKMKIVVIYQPMLGKLMLVSRHFVCIAIKL